KYALGERGLRRGDLAGITRTDGLCNYLPRPTWQEPKEPDDGSDDHGSHDRLLVLDHGLALLHETLLKIESFGACPGANGRLGGRRRARVEGGNGVTCRRDFRTGEQHQRRRWHEAQGGQVL